MHFVLFDFVFCFLLSKQGHFATMVIMFVGGTPLICVLWHHGVSVLDNFEHGKLNCEKLISQYNNLVVLLMLLMVFWRVQPHWKWNKINPKILQDAAISRLTVIGM
jgi:hypothetical protein